MRDLEKENFGNIANDEFILKVCFLLKKERTILMRSYMKCLFLLKIMSDFLIIIL